MYKVCKRNGEVVKFDLSKIKTAITKAFESNHSKLLTSFEFEKLIESMYSRYSLDI